LSWLAAFDLAAECGAIHTSTWSSGNHRTGPTCRAATCGQVYGTALRVDELVRISSGLCKPFRGACNASLHEEVAGWPQVVTFPGLPQIRTCSIKAYGSLGHGFATRGYTEWTTRGLASGNTFKITAIRSQSNGRLERRPNHLCEMRLTPSYTSSSARTFPVTPVGVVAIELLVEGLGLLLDRQMSVFFAPLRDVKQSAPKAGFSSSFVSPPMCPSWTDPSRA
jgi:hypothetical protein